MRGLRIETQNGTDRVLVSVEGEVDLASAAELEDALQRALQGSARSLVVDLRAVQFLDSSGLSLLVRQGRLARAGDRRLIVIKGPPHVHQVFEVTGLSGHLTMVGEPPE